MLVRNMQFGQSLLLRLLYHQAKAFLATIDKGIMVIDGSVLAHMSLFSYFRFEAKPGIILQ